MHGVFESVVIPCQVREAPWGGLPSPYPSAGLRLFRRTSARGGVRTAWSPGGPPQPPPGPPQCVPESAQVHARDTPSAPKHAKDLDKDAPSAPKHAKDLEKDAKGQIKAPLISPIARNTIKTNVFSMFLKAPKDPQRPPLDQSRAPRDLPRTPQGPPRPPQVAPKDLPRTPKDPPRTPKRRPESAQVDARDAPSAPKHAKDLDKDAKEHPKASLIAQIGENTIKTNVFQCF